MTYTEAEEFWKKQLNKLTAEEFLKSGKRWNKCKK